MPNKSHSNRQKKQSKTPAVVTDNHKQRSPEACARLVSLGVPKALADTFPLTPHLPTKRWCKKLKTPHGWKVFYFGSLGDWQAALDRFRSEAEDLIKGQTPTTRNKDGLTLLDLLNKFLHFKRGLVSTGELTMRSWNGYYQTGERLLKVFGKDRLVESLTPPDFERLRADYGNSKWGVRTINSEINNTNTIIRDAFESGLINTPSRTGPGFRRPDSKTLRKARAKDRQVHGARMFAAEELRRIIDACPQPMKSMVLLGINGGLNNADVGTVGFTNLDLQ